MSVPTTNHRQPGMRSHRISILVMLLLVAVLITGINAQRYREFQHRHTAIAQESVRGVTAELVRFIRDRQRLVSLFTEDHRAMLEALVADPDNESRYRALDTRVARYFPDYSVYAITDPQGRLVVHDYNFMVGDMCLEDIRSFTASGARAPRVHPGMNVHHFDLLGEFSMPQGDFILLISFNADILGSMLTHLQTPDHELVLVLDDTGMLLEASAAGSRREFFREDYRLTDAEQDRILASRTIPGTRWRALDLRAPGLYAAMRGRLIIEGMALFMLFALLSGLMLVFLTREERRRRKAEGAKDEFLAIVSHELRTPITSIMGSLGLMANEVAGTLPERARQLASLALANGERLLLLVNDLLDIQRIEAGKLDIDRQPIELNALVRDCLEHNRAYADKFGSHFVLHDTAPGIMIDGDPQRLAQVLDNLLSNAAKYGREQDEVTVRITRDEGWARVSVEDHGPGIPEAFRAHIFGKFSQGDASHRRRRDGTGLGLFIARSLIEQHDGRMGFDSTPGEGSTFFFELPVAHG